eukprot:283801-Hanusia_phi.AAC.3
MKQSWQFEAEMAFIMALYTLACTKTDLRKRWWAVMQVNSTLLHILPARHWTKQRTESVTREFLGTFPRRIRSDSPAILPS